MSTGFSQIIIENPLRTAAIEASLFYPASRQTRPLMFGAFSIEAAPEAPIEGQNLPLVVISHGNGGYPQAHWTLARALAENGMLAALIRHPGNNQDDNALANTLACVSERPRHLARAIEAILTHPRFGLAIDRTRIALAGHSLGGYTALALAGGMPVTTNRETPGGPRQSFDVPHRAVQALVLLAPATIWFPAPVNLKGVTAPIFLRTGGRDLITPDTASDVIRKGVSSPRPLDDKTFPEAEHFDFMDLPPISPGTARQTAVPPPVPLLTEQEQFLCRLNGEIVAFLKRTL